MDKEEKFPKHPWHSIYDDAMFLTDEGQHLKCVIDAKVKEVIKQFPDVNPREIGLLFVARSDMETTFKVLRWQRDNSPTWGKPQIKNAL